MYYEIEKLAVEKEEKAKEFEKKYNTDEQAEIDNILACMNDLDDEF